MEKEIGKVVHYFDNARVAVIDINGKLNVNDKIHVKGITTDFISKVKSMQINHEDVKTVKKGDDVGLKIKERVRVNDVVYLIKD